MMPIVDGLEAEFEGRVSIIRLDADVAVNARLQADYGLRGHPAFVVLDGNSQIIESYFGPQTADALREALSMMTASES